MDRYGAGKLVPWAAIVSILIGLCTNYLISSNKFWGKPEISSVFFTAILTINGLFLALSWGSFAKIYEIASEPKLAQYLRKHELLHSYTFHVDYIHYTQVLALSFSGIAMILCVVKDLPLLISNWVPLVTLQQIGLVACISSTR